MTDEKKKTGKKDRRAENRIGDPISLSGIGSRIEAIADELGGKRALSKKTGIHETQIYRYINGTSAPDLQRLAMIAVAGDESLDWLVLGRSSKKYREANHTDANSAESHDAINGDLLQTIVAAVEEALIDAGRTLSPEKKSELISLLYSMYAGSRSQLDKNKVFKLVKSVA